MNEFLSQLVYWHWFALALILGILDVTFGANFFFVWCGAAAALVAVLLLIVPSLTWEYQFLIFGIGVMTSLLFWRQYLKTHPKNKDASTLNRRAAQYIGRVFTLEEPIVNGRGKVRVDDTIWRVEGTDLPIGEKVKVVSVDGVVLKVEGVK
jgi:membrane protein implicated in regulation of membrane protease activity